MNDLILGNFVNGTRFASHKSESVRELMHAIAMRKKFIESQHLVKFIHELIFLSFFNKFVCFGAAKFESAFRRKSILWSV